MPHTVTAKHSKTPSAAKKQAQCAGLWVKHFYMTAFLLLLLLHIQELCSKYIRMTRCSINQKSENVFLFLNQQLNRRKIRKYHFKVRLPHGKGIIPLVSSQGEGMVSQQVLEISDIQRKDENTRDSERSSVTLLSLLLWWKTTLHDRR